MSTSTDTSSPVTALARLDIDTVAPRFSRALAALDAATTRELDDAGIDPALRELIRLRASQLNGCAYCIAEHTRDALEAGEGATRLTSLAAWRESSFFTAKERTALALTDAITRSGTADVAVADALWGEASTRFTPAQLGALVALITTINAWNAVGVSTRAWEPVA
ncbi:carboxymuconolactone decarboxylase family protein [uncultured Microbacterium sp.]|uniref:carboxymuconolactone decarboxylase family protein n=1 Tax=uncultured Microbacterium sp. TaxID=191216 RepID=UPI0025DD44A7|nr:carboxymuconolactone decarboxylase family protein [uncultured Microbacterium sp.]